MNFPQNLMTFPQRVSLGFYGSSLQMAFVYSSSTSHPSPVLVEEEDSKMRELLQELERALTFYSTHNGGSSSLDPATVMSYRLAMQVGSGHIFSKHVFAGRRGKVKDHYGNIYLHQLISMKHQQYEIAERWEKTVIADGIVSAIRERGVRFIRLLQRQNLNHKRRNSKLLNNAKLTPFRLPGLKWMLPQLVKRCRIPFAVAGH